MKTRQISGLDLRFDDLAKLTEGLLEGSVVGDPGKAANEAAILDVGSCHRSQKRIRNPRERYKEGEKRKPAPF